MTVFIAIGIILSAAVACRALGARLRKAADSRGFAMQTLIVTAVFVLVAAGVAVVIIAVTGGSKDGLEGASRTDSESPEARYGVLTPDGEVSKTWRCALHQVVVTTKSGQEYLECKDRCWGSLSTQGKKKWNWLFYPDEPRFEDVTDFTPEELAADDGPKAFFTRDDFDGIVFSQSDPGPGHPKIDSNGAVIALVNRCILAQEICEFPPSQRESLVSRWRNSVEATSQGAEGLPAAPGSVSELLGILRDCT